MKLGSPKYTRLQAILGGGLAAVLAFSQPISLAIAADLKAGPTPASDESVRDYFTELGLAVPSDLKAASPHLAMVGKTDSKESESSTKLVAPVPASVRASAADVVSADRSVGQSAAQPSLQRENPVTKPVSWKNLPSSHALSAQESVPASEATSESAPLVAPSANAGMTNTAGRGESLALVNAAATSEFVASTDLPPGDPLLAQSGSTQNDPAASAAAPAESDASDPAAAASLPTAQSIAKPFVPMATPFPGAVLLHKGSPAVVIMNAPQKPVPNAPVLPAAPATPATDPAAAAAPSPAESPVPALPTMVPVETQPSFDQMQTEDEESLPSPVTWDQGQSGQPATSGGDANILSLKEKFKGQPASGQGTQVADTPSPHGPYGPTGQSIADHGAGGPEQAATGTKPGTKKNPAAFPSAEEGGIASGLSGTKREDGPGGVPAGRDANQLQITNSRQPKRGININSENPSVRHVTMSPASKRFGGDDVEIVISPIYDVLIQMPDSIEYFKSSSTALKVDTVQTNQSLVSLKLSPVLNPVPISLHLVDINQNIYTFTVIGTTVDIAWEYPKTIIVSKRLANKVKIGSSNPRSIIEAMDVDDAIQIVVGDVPNTSEYDVEFISGHYMHYEGYAQYAFRVSRKDHANIENGNNGQPNLKFTIWANNRRLDAGNAYADSREIEWTIEPILSKRETRRKGYEVLRVFVQVRASILDLEDWESAFVTVSTESGYTRTNFPPLIREFRAPTRSSSPDEDHEN